MCLEVQKDISLGGRERFRNHEEMVVLQRDSRRRGKGKRWERKRTLVKSNLFRSEHGATLRSQRGKWGKCRTYQTQEYYPKKEFPGGGRSQWKVTEPSLWKGKALNRQLDLAIRRSLVTSETAGRGSA